MRFWIAALLAFCAAVQVRAGMLSDSSLYYCKCICFDNSTIIPLWRPEVLADPSKPCLSCTRQFCLDQKLPICKGAQVPVLDPDVGTGTEGDVEARCFKRDSKRDEIVVIAFVVITAGLLVFAKLRSKLRREIERNGTPNSPREWLEALLPTYIRRRYFGGGGGGMRQAYSPVSLGNVS